MVEARTLQFQQEQIASGNIVQGRVEQFSQTQKKKEVEAEAKYQAALKSQEQARIDAANASRARAYNYQKAKDLADRYFAGDTIQGSEYLRLDPEARAIYRDMTRGYAQHTPSGTVQVEGIGGFSVAPELQKDFATKYQSKGYKVETEKYIYPAPALTNNLSKDEVVIDYEGYSVARERQAPFILNRLGREQTALKKEQEKYYKVDKVVKQNNDLLFNPFVRKANIFLGTQFDKAYEFTKGSAKESWDLFYTNSGLRNLSNKQKQSESYKKSIKAKEEREEFYFKRREKLKEDTGLDFETFGKSIASPISFGISNLGTTFPKAKERLGVYFEKNPEQLIFTKLGLGAADWLAVGKLFPKVGKLPEEVRVRPLAKIKEPKTEGFDFKKLDSNTFIFKEKIRAPRRFAYYSKPSQEGGIIFGKEIKKTYSKPRTYEQEGLAVYDNEGFIVGKSILKDVKKPNVQEGYLLYGKSEIKDFEKLTIDKQLKSLLGKDRIKSIGNKSIALGSEKEQFFEGAINTVKIARVRGKKVTDTTDNFVDDLGIIRIKKPMMEMNIQTKNFNGRRLTRAEIKGVQRKIGEGDLGETFAYKFASKDVTFPTSRPRRYPTTKGFSFIQREAPPKFNDFFKDTIQKTTTKRLELDVVGRQVSKSVANTLPRPKPVSRNKSSKQILSNQYKPTVAQSAFYGKGTYERTESSTSILSPSKTSLDLRQSYSTILRSSPQSIVRVQQKESSGMKEQLINLELTRQLENTRQVELVRQQPRLKEQLRSSTLQAFKMPTPTRPSITPRVRPPRIPTPRTPRVVKPKFNFKLKSPKLKSIFAKKQRDSFDKYTPSYSALALNIRSKKKPTRTKGGYFFGFRPILD